MGGRREGGGGGKGRGGKVFTRVGRRFRRGGGGGWGVAFLEVFWGGWFMRLDVGGVGMDGLRIGKGKGKCRVFRIIFEIYEFTWGFLAGE